MKKGFVLGFLFVLLASVLVVGQEKSEPANTPHVSKYVWISTETTNPGKYTVFGNMVKQIKQSAVAANSDFYWLAGYNVTGHGRLVTFVSFHDDLASVDKTMAAMEKVEHAAMMANANFAAESAESQGAFSNSILAKYRDDLSFNPTKLPASQTTRWLVETMELKPGTMMDAEDLIKQEIELVKKANPDEHWITYQVIAGGPSPTLMFVVPLRTLADLDEMDKKSDAMKAVFTDPIRRHFSSVIKSIAMHTENNIVAVSPELSRPPQTMIAANPGFWTVKEEAPVMATKAKKTKKLVESTPKTEEKKQ